MKTETPEGQGRAPQIDTAMFAMMTELDRFIAKAPLTRAENAELGAIMSRLLQRLENDSKELLALREQVSQLQAVIQQRLPALHVAENGGRIVEEVLAEQNVFDKRA